MAMQYAYIYAQINPNTNMCIGVHSMTYEITDENWIEIPVNDPEYCFKYYINGAWYVDAAGTIPWESSLL